MADFMWCVCPEGPYNGTYMAGSVPRCERCGLLPNEPWVTEALFAALLSIDALQKRTTRTDYTVGGDDFSVVYHHHKTTWYTSPKVTEAPCCEEDEG